MAQINQFLAVISNITGKKTDFEERNFMFCFLCFVNSESVAQRCSLQTENHCKIPLKEYTF